MKALFIGGTGTISTNIAQYAHQCGWDITLINRGNRSDRILPEYTLINADINIDEKKIETAIADLFFDVIVDFIAFVPGQLERDFRLFKDKTKQFIFISSASAYQKPLNHYRITESTPLVNPYWEYSRNKIVCEDYLVKQYRENGFPCTIIRPSHTYDERYLPVAIHGNNGSWQVLHRILNKKPVLIQGDGTSLWTLTHAKDFAKAFVGIMGHPLAIGEIFHITSDEALTWNQIYDAIGEALGEKPIKYHVSSSFLSYCDPELKGTLTGDKSNTVVFDNSKIKQLVPSFSAEIRFSEGVKSCVKYLLDNPSLQVEDKEFDLFCDRVINAQEEAKNIYFGSITR